MKDKKSISKQQHLGEKRIVSVILLPLRPASLMHENPQRFRIICGIRHIRLKDQLSIEISNLTEKGKKNAEK